MGRWHNTELSTRQWREISGEALWLGSCFQSGMTRLMESGGHPSLALYHRWIAVPVLAAIACGSPAQHDAGPGNAAGSAAGTGLQSTASSAPKTGTATIRCPEGGVLTELGWSNLVRQYQLGDVFSAAIDHVGDESCLSLLYSGHIPVEPLIQTTQFSAALETPIVSGLSIDFSPEVPASVRDTARTELVEHAQMRLDGASVQSVPPSQQWGNLLDPSGTDSQEWTTIFPNSSLNAYSAYALTVVVTRLYGARAVSNESSLDYASPNTLDNPELDYRLDASYACAELPAAGGGAQLFFDAEVYPTRGTQLQAVDPVAASAPHRLCPAWPGVDISPHDGASDSGVPGAPTAP